jgi:hypothetical protein
MLPKFEDLSKEQLNAICNGCGKKGGFFKPPNWFMLASCNHHDYGYWKGCTEADRLKCDETFLREMKKDVKRSNIFLRPIRYSAAYTYYFAVRKAGKSAFYYAKNPKTIEDLNQEVLMNRKTLVK